MSRGTLLSIYEDISRVTEHFPRGPGGSLTRLPYPASAKRLSPCTIPLYLGLTNTTWTRNYCGAVEEDKKIERHRVVCHLRVISVHRSNKKDQAVFSCSFSLYIHTYFALLGCNRRPQTRGRFVTHVVYQLSAEFCRPGCVTLCPITPNPHTRSLPHQLELFTSLFRRVTANEVVHVILQILPQKLRNKVTQKKQEHTNIRMLIEST